MSDRFENHASGLDGPITEGFAVSPHDVNLLPEVTRALYIGASGTVRVVLQSGSQLTFSNVASSSMLPVRAIAVLATGTTATDILGLV